MKMDAVGGVWRAADRIRLLAYGIPLSVDSCRLTAFGIRLLADR